jgi:predicted aspartyl protease
MQSQVKVNGATLTALLDSGSTHNFLDDDVAARVGITFHDRPGLRVSVANGDRLISSGCCCALPVHIGDEVFNVDCYGLQLGSFDMVL